jgi:hypothetical protein
MSVYVIYKQEKGTFVPKDTFVPLDRTETEKEGRDELWAFFAATVFQDSFNKNENFKLFLFKGANNVDGELIVSVEMKVRNTKR